MCIRDSFETVEIVAGEKLKPGQSGIMINESQFHKFSDWFEKPLSIGDPLLIQGFSTIGFRLRELPIVGIFRLKEQGTAPEQLAYIDIESLRVMSGMTVGANEPIQLKPEQTSMLSIEDPDELFSDDIIVTSETSKHFDVASISRELSRPSEIDPLKPDEGAWQFIVGKADSSQNIDRIISSLNKAV